MSKNLPDFILVGAAKCGTSSLHAYLAQHPDIFMPKLVKEPNFFAYKDKPLTIRGPKDEKILQALLLKKTITITQEVRQAALAWKDQGALLFGISDKPDEASIPTEAMARQGFQPIHRIETDVVGG